MADYQCIQGALASEARQYQQAWTRSQQLEQLARRLTDPAVLAHALMYHQLKKFIGAILSDFR
ncbi:MAG: hypothetical protein IMW89_17330 [Ktedonobacteraceae bacterium]|nr:hypothetical protein [Ktedonobacteraceae bacterium]